MPVLYSAGGGENCFRRSCVGVARTDFCKCGIAAGSNGKAPLRKSEKTIETPTLRRFDAPPPRGLSRWSEREIKRGSRHRETHRNAQKIQKAQKAQKTQKNTEKAQKKKERKYTACGRKGGGRGDRSPCAEGRMLWIRRASRTLFRFCSDDFGVIPCSCYYNNLAI